MTAFARRSAALALVAVAAAGCTPWGSTSETIELEGQGQSAEVGAGLTVDDGGTEVLGESITRDSTTTSIMQPAPTTTEPMLPPTTFASPPTTAAPATTAAPPPTPAPTTAAPPTVAPLPALGPNSAKALERLTTDQSRDVAARALGLISFDWRNGLPGWELRFLDGRSGYRGLTYPEERVIEVFVRGGDTPESLAHVVAHEMGHAIDVSRFNDADRAVWASARGYSGRAPWWVASGGSDFASGAGDFAESFAWWQVAGDRWFGELGPPPTPAQVALLGALTYSR